MRIAIVAAMTTAGAGVEEEEEGEASDAVTVAIVTGVEVGGAIGAVGRDPPLPPIAEGGGEEAGGGTEGTIAGAVVAMTGGIWAGERRGRS